MPETVMVTVCFGGRELDLELPAARPIHQWETDALSAFGVSSGGRRLSWYFEGRTLSAKESLLQYGIFDGAVLELGLGGEAE